MSDWNPIAVLPNLLLQDRVGCDLGIIAPIHDEAVQAAGARQPELLRFLERFDDGFGGNLKPAVLLISSNAPDSYLSPAAVVALRDAVAVSYIVAGRASAVRNDTGFGRPLWGETFSIYPWSLSKDGDLLIARTSALFGERHVDGFRGQGIPGLPTRSLRPNQADIPLLARLLQQWTCRFNGDLPTEADVQLFRSLGMAFHATMMVTSGGTYGTHYDVGRLITLWVSAFEILIHPGRDRDTVNYSDVMDHLDRAPWKLPQLKVLTAGAKGPLRTPAAHLYYTVHTRRNDYAHGNLVAEEQLWAGQTDLLMVASSLYRMLLADHLQLRPTQEPPPEDAPLEEWARHIAIEIDFWATQTDCEHAIERALIRDELGAK